MMPRHLLERDERQAMAVPLCRVRVDSRGYVLSQIQRIWPLIEGSWFKRYITADDLRTEISRKTHRCHFPCKAVHVEFHGTANIHLAIRNIDRLLSKFRKDAKKLSIHRKNLMRLTTKLSHTTCKLDI